MTDQILFVDDEANVLEAYQRTLRKDFSVSTASGGEAGLALLESQGPFAVVVADRRMPGLDGVQFLARVRELSPDTVRMMLTGQADLDSTIEAVNAGNIFRFLTKPCPREALVTALLAGLEQYRLITAERELLKNTLVGSIRVLVELLSAVSPLALSRTSHLRRSMRHMAANLNLPNQWQYELAGLLSQIGVVTLPADLLHKFYGGEALKEDEQRMFAAHPAKGQHMLENIPRLEAIARMVGAQREPYGSWGPNESIIPDDPIFLGSQMLFVALDYDQLRVWGLPHKAALEQMQRRPGRYNPNLLAALESMSQADDSRVKAEVEGMAVASYIQARDLQIGMVAAEDIRAKDGTCLVSKGQYVTYPVLDRVRNYAERLGLVEPLCIERSNSMLYGVDAAPVRKDLAA